MLINYWVDLLLNLIFNKNVKIKNFNALIHVENYVTSIFFNEFKHWLLIIYYYEFS